MACLLMCGTNAAEKAQIQGPAQDWKISVWPSFWEEKRPITM